MLKRSKEMANKKMRKIKRMRKEITPPQTTDMEAMHNEMISSKKKNKKRTGRKR